MTLHYQELYIRRGENFYRVRNRRGRHLRVKISPGKIPPAGEDLGGRTYNGTPALNRLSLES